MDIKLTPTLNEQKIPNEYLEMLWNYLPQKCEYFNGQLSFNGGELTAEDLLTILIYYVGLEKTIKLVPKKLWKEAFQKIYNY